MSDEEFGIVKNPNTPVTLVLSARELALALTSMQIINKLFAAIVPDSETDNLLLELIPRKVMWSFGVMAGVADNDEGCPTILISFIQRLMDKAKDTYDLDKT